MKREAIVNTIGMLSIAIFLLGSVPTLYAQSQSQIEQVKEIDEQKLKTAFGDAFTSEVVAKCETDFESLDNCLELEYISPTTAVFNGAYYVYNQTLVSNNPNTFLWKAMDILQSKGYIVESVVTSGQGTSDIPTNYHVVMLKKAS